ncbi:MAG: hypothetical protein NVS2B12_04600 [Ktedonobacteraceae bacterium]
MQKDDQEKQQEVASTQDELSPVWRELLGTFPTQESNPAEPTSIEIPTLASDPWRSLLHERGVEVVDLQKNLLHMSDGDVEQMLQRMREQSAQEDENSSSTSR